MIITRALSITNFIVASSALSFQVGVLYPWHKQLDDDFEALKREHLRVLTAVEGKVGRTQEPALLEEHRPSILGMIGNLAPWKA
ncbi:mitochondrial phosphate carrier [Fusarium sporotrichioides]|uniref:Mitochondrial phosphate carrier n=1 Tax=Fusarium sporotrichioides TaxID=5514 RepID=A0A395SP25_FUSSP|nr:mitochondrial phosphate carrier [Fusarium sporotrichioides]